MDERPEPRLHRPKRWLIVAAEVLLAAGLITAAVWAWQRGIVPMEYPSKNGAPYQLERYEGQWWAFAAVLGIAAGLALLDAIRQAMLAKRGKFEPQPIDLVLGLND